MIVYYKTAPVKISSFWPRLKSLMPTVMMVVGASLLISVGYPILSYELTIGLKSQRQNVISPVPRESLAQTAPVLAQTDYNQVSSWFNFSQKQTFLTPSNITHYTLSIPKLRIKDALVTIGGDNLWTSLIQYGGTANPGEAGSVVIFGHSILQQFYNPSSYRAIFSLIPTLKSGDEILISFDGIIYKYIVYDYFEVAPGEIDVLEQQYDHRDLTLVTCVPPGTMLRRGIVKAKLVEI